MNHAAIPHLSAQALLAAIRKGEVTAVGALRAYRTRVEQVNPKINALVAFHWESAFARAEALDARAARGDWAGPLHGLPMSVKEGFHVAGMATTVGDPRLRQQRPKHTAAAVQLLEAAGAVIFAKSNVPMHMSDLQSYNAVYGVSRNPWDLRRTPGGSSGGAAAALAACLTPIELGSDLAGSIRIPAHFCGVYGHRPTFDLVPVRGHFIGKRSYTGLDFTVAGPMARTVADLQLALEVLAKPVTAAGTPLPCPLLPAPTKPLSEWRVGVWLNDPKAPIDDVVRDVLQSAVAKLKAAGCTVIEGAPEGFNLDALYDLYFAQNAASIGAGIPSKQYAQAEKASFAARFLGGPVNTLIGFAQRMTVSHRQWCEGQEQLAKLKHQAAMGLQAADVWLLPSNICTAPEHVAPKSSFYRRWLRINGQATRYAEQMRWAAPSALLGLPVTNAPVGLARDGLPVGVQIMAGEFADRSTLAFAALLEQLIGGFVAPPEQVG